RRGGRAREPRRRHRRAGRCARAHGTARRRARRVGRRRVSALSRRRADRHERRQRPRVPRAPRVSRRRLWHLRPGFSTFPGIYRATDPGQARTMRTILLAVAATCMIMGAAQAQPVCGNGVVEPPEQCDDGNLLPNDCCAPDCTITNQPPVCTGAFATPDYLWPPNHEMVPVAIDGVVDPEGDPLAIRVTDIAQDEPIGGSCPNGVGLGLDGVTLRTERDGGGDGRVYHVAFEAVDVCGAPCMGEVTVCVPHDQGNGSVCVDGGAIYDATFGGAASCGQT